MYVDNAHNNTFVSSVSLSMLLLYLSFSFIYFFLSSCPPFLPCLLNSACDILATRGPAIKEMVLMRNKCLTNIGLCHIKVRIPLEYWHLATQFTPRKFQLKHLKEAHTSLPNALLIKDMLFIIIHEPYVSQKQNKIRKKCFLLHSISVSKN